MDNYHLNKFDKKKESDHNGHSKKSITLRNVQRLYPLCEFVSVNEFWIYGQGWIKNEVKGNITEQIKAALELGATKLQLHIRQHQTKQDIFTDYHAKELTE